jgi:hypothetical protein
VNASRRSSPLPDVGLGSAFGGWFGVTLALLWNFDLPLGLVIGAAVGVLIGASIDALNSRRDRRDERRTPPEQ